MSIGRSCVRSDSGGPTAWRFLAAGFCVYVAAVAGTTHARGDELRVMTYNIWVGLNENDELARQLALIDAAGADIIGLQEHQGAAAPLAAALGFYSHSFGSDNAIVSRFPIVETMPDGVRVDLGSGNDAMVFDVHLAAYPYQPYDLRDGLISTEEEAIAAAEAARASRIAGVLAQMNDPVQSGVPSFLVGDFNEPSHLDWTQPTVDAGLHPIAVAWPTSTAVVGAGLRDSYRDVHPDPVTRAGNTWTPRPPGSNETHDRIDRVYYAGTGVVPTQSLVIGEPGGPDVDIASVGVFPSDHRAVVSTFSLPFDIPAPPPPGPPAPSSIRSGWNFDAGDLSAAPGSSGVLHYLDDGGRSTELLTLFGTTAGGAEPTGAVPDLPDGPAHIMRFPDLAGVDHGFRINHNSPDNDGPSVGYLDSYTVMMDLYIAENPASGYIGLINTNERHANAAEVWLDFSSSSGGFWRQGAPGGGATSSHGSIHLGRWHRIALVVTESDRLDIFVDGEKVAAGVPWDAGDSIYSTWAPDPSFGEASFSLFGDDGGEHGPGYVSSLAMFDHALPDELVALMGGPSAAGIVTTAVPGDTDGDLHVTVDDYVRIRDHFFDEGVGRGDGDLTDDGRVDFDDFYQWVASYPGGPDAARAAVAAIPEPPALLLVLGAVAVAGSRRSALGKRRRSARTPVSGATIDAG